MAVNVLTQEMNRVDCGYQIHKTERKIRNFLCMNDLKLQVRDEDELQNEIKILRAFAKNIVMNFVLKNFAIFNNSGTYSTIVYQLLILCRSEINLDILRQ